MGEGPSDVPTGDKIYDIADNWKTSILKFIASYVFSKKPLRWLFIFMISSLVFETVLFRVLTPKEERLTYGIGSTQHYSAVHKPKSEAYKITRKVMDIVIPVSFWLFVLFLIIKFGFAKKIQKIKEITQFIPENIVKEDNNQYSLTLETHGEPLYVNNPFRGILCIAGSGSGKSESVERQLMKSAINQNYCGLVYDFKYPTLTDELEGYLFEERSNTKHYNINFFDLERTNRVNPLHPDYIKNASYAREFSISIINNLLPESLEKKDFWIRSCTDLLTATIFYLAKERPQFSSLPHAVAFILQDEKRIIELLSQNLQSRGMIKSLETALRNESNEQLTGVVSTLQSALSVLNTPEIFYVLSENEFSLEINNPKEPIWLSLGNSAVIPETYSPVISLIITVALKQMNQQGKHHSIVILDEAPTIYIPKLELIPATARSNKVSIAFFAQDMSQIVEKYGQKLSDVIIGLLNNQFYGRLSHQKTMEYVSKLFGKTDVYFDQYSNSSGKSNSYGSGVTFGSNEGEGQSLVVQERERIKAQDISKFEPGRFCGMLVESKNSEFNVMFKRVECNSLRTLIVNSNIDIDANFVAIHESISELFT
jgi:hypothetical protein